MSLTGHLRESTSPIRQYLVDLVPHTYKITSQCTSKLRSIPQKKPHPNQDRKFLFLIGHAIDYRIRFAYEIPDLETLVAAQGLRCLRGTPYLKTPQNRQRRILECEGIGAQFFAYAHLWFRLHAPLHKLENAEEIECLRICYVLSLFEIIYRGGLTNSPLLTPTSKNDVASLLAMPTEEELEDLFILTESFFKSCSEWLTSPTILNPTFRGSSDVGGADADLIVGRTLYEIKTVTWMNKFAQWIRQLAGYILLDYEDKYRMSGVGFYFVRSGCTISWTIDEFFSILTQGNFQSLQEHRNRFHSFLQSVNKRNII
jgi:hypothetical protein